MFLHKRKQAFPKLGEVISLYGAATDINRREDRGTGGIVFVLFYTYCGLVWRCFVFCLLFLLFYVICTPVLTEKPRFFDIVQSQIVRQTPYVQNTRLYLEYPLAASHASLVRRFSFSIHTSNQKLYVKLSFC